MSGSRRPLHEFPPPSRLTVFAVLWACQALVHQDFFSTWLTERSLLGTLVTVFALGTFLWPRRLHLFALMLISSVAYNLEKWPFVVNHILIESLANLSMLGAMTMALLGGTGRWPLDRRAQNRTFDRFAPVLRLMLVVMYYFAFTAKLNTGFLDPDVSCVAVIYGDLVDRFAFLPQSMEVKMATIGLTLIVEASIPLLLTFRRTRYLAIAIGLPFHFMLGLVGYRTFSSLAYAMYGVFCIRHLTAFVVGVHRRFARRGGLARVARAVPWLRGAIVLGAVALMAAELTGHNRLAVGPLKVYHARWLVWIAWSFVVGAAYAAVMWSRPWGTARTRILTAAPGALWMLVLPVVLSGVSPYVGLKTENSFTMYSNLRTENGRTNHLLIPLLRLADYQDDLVEIVDTDQTELHEYLEQQEWLTYFELQRAVSTTDYDFSVDYRRNGELRRFTRQGGYPSDASLATPPPTWLAKLLRFRPVDMGREPSCRH